MISWLPPSEPNGDILGYSLYMKTMEQGRQFTQDFSLGPHINYYTMSGLHQVCVLSLPLSSPLTVLAYSPMAISCFSIYFGEIRSDYCQYLLQDQPYSFWVSAFTLAGEGQVSEIVAETPQVSIPAGIASFSRMVIRALKESVEMKCVTVGIPAPTLQWRKK